MSDALIEKMVAAYLDKLEPYTDASGFDHQAAMRAALAVVLAVVLAHYSDPANVSDGMVEALQIDARFRMIGEESDSDYHRRCIAAAMRATLTES